MRRLTRSAVLCGMGLILVSTLMARAGEDASASYQAWAKFAPGSTNQYDLLLQMPAGPRHMSMKNTLVSVDADKVSVEMSIGGMPGGGEHSSTRDYAAKDKVAFPDPTGTEDLSVAGKTYHCKMYDLNQDQLKSMGDAAGTGASRMPPGTQMHVKIWTCSDIPGAVVKVHSEVTVNQHTMVTEMTLTSFDAK